MEGQVYRGQQGTGKATVLPSDNMSGFLDYIERERTVESEAQKKAAESQDKILKSFEKLNNENFDGWYRHETEIGAELDVLRDAGISLLERGIDPYTSPTKEAMEFREQQAKIERMSKYSTQLKDEWTKTYAEINKNPDKYRAEDRLATVSYFEQPISSHVQGISKPLLRVKSPEMHMAGLAVQFLKAAKDNGSDLSTNRQAIVDGWLVNEDAITAANTELAELKMNYPDVFKELQKKATYAGEDVVKYYMKSYINSTISEPEFNINEFLREEAIVSPSVTSYTNPKGGKSDRTSYDKSEFPDVAKRLLAGNSRLRQAFAKEFNAPDYNSIKKEAEQFIVDYLEENYKDESSTVATPDDGSYGGFSETEADANFELWYRDFVKGMVSSADYASNISITGNTGSKGNLVPVSMAKSHFNQLIHDITLDGDVTGNKDLLAELGRIEIFVNKRLSGSSGVVVMPPKVPMDKFFTGEGLNRKLNISELRNYVKLHLAGNVISGSGTTREKARLIYTEAIRKNKALYKKGIQPKPKKGNLPAF